MDYIEIPPLPEDVKQIQAFNQQQFQRHMECLAPWQAEIGARMGQVFTELELRKVDLDEARGMMKRREALMTQQFLAAKLAGAKEWTEARMAAEVLLDAQYIDLQDRAWALARAVAEIMGTYESIKRTLANPLDTKASMMLASAGQFRVEKEAWNAQRGR